MDRRVRVAPVRRTSAAAALLALLLAGVPTATLAQDADVDLAALLPTQLAGTRVPPENVIVRTGTDLTQGSAQLKSQYQQIVDATGVPIDEMGQASAFVQSEDGELLSLAVLRVTGADAAVVRDVVLPIVLEGWDGSVTEEIELAGLDVTVLHGDSSEVDAVYFYPSGELLWLVSGLEDVVATTLADITG